MARATGVFRFCLPGNSADFGAKLPPMWFVVAMLFALPLASAAQSLEDHLVTAGENNPELRAYFNEYQASLERIPQVGSLPDPELTLGVLLRPMERLMGKQRVDVQLMQMFPWFGMLATREDEASLMARARYETFRNAKNELYFAVKETWFQMYLLDEEIRITEQTRGLLQTLENLALVRYQSGSSGASTAGSSARQSMQPAAGGTTSGMSMGASNAVAPAPSRQAAMPAASMTSGGTSMADVLRIRMEIRELENSLALLKEARAPQDARFNQLLNRPSDEAVGRPDTLLAASLSEGEIAMLDSMAANNPMLKMLEAEKLAFGAQRQMATLEGRPMLGAGINYVPFSPRLENGMPMGGDDMWMPMVSVSIPLYRKKYSAMVREAEYGERAAEQRINGTLSELRVQWAQAKRSLNDASRRILFFTEQLQLAQQTLDILMTSFVAEGGGFDEVLRLHQQILNYKLELTRAVVDQNTSAAMLEMLAATAIEK